MSKNRQPVSGRRQEEASSREAGSEAAQVPIDGFQQVLEMLKIADPAFRESLLARLAARDQELARSLRRDLADL